MLLILSACCWSSFHPIDMGVDLPESSFYAFFTRSHLAFFLGVLSASYRCLFPRYARSQSFLPAAGSVCRQLIQELVCQSPRLVASASRFFSRCPNQNATYQQTRCKLSWFGRWSYGSRKDSQAAKAHPLVTKLPPQNTLSSLSQYLAQPVHWPIVCLSVYIMVALSRGNLQCAVH
ncbi:hypothetical protein FN846DRAFT_614408 [Sphaerosporella brunnea]|uniref:Uncharacterized protein n=1 Tax=Sphaerosporella brunnea TaxID=1250544 RepID=A0A5J5EBW3_9PEZI|nr:hypothetical protein FN846DRAFT_614408 [Sphaerosporella brunnea]